MGSFRILLADDHPVFRLGVRSLLASRERWEVCGEAGDGRDAVEKSKTLKPDLVILDICMPGLNGVDAARQMLKHNPSLRILVLTAVDSEQIIRDCLELGVRGWVFKADGTDDLMAAVEALERHRSTFSARVSNLVLDGYLRRPRLDVASAMPRKLSPREREIVQLVAEGRSSKEVAITLGMSVKTVETHRSNILVKLSIHSIAEVVLYAVRNGIINMQIPAALLQTAHPANKARVLSLSA